MKNLSRLTALLLAVMLLFQTAALANTGVSRSDLDRDTWDAWVQEATEAAEAQSNQNVTITEGGEVYVNEPASAPVDTPIYESTESVALNMAAAGAEREISVTLPQYGKVQLTVGESGGQWQVQVGEQWINVAGENGSVFDVTFAKVQSLFQLNGYAKVRYAAADGAFVSDTAVIGLSYGSQTLEEDDLDSVSDEPVMMFAARRSANDGIATVAEGDEGEVKDLYNVVINYVFQDGKQAANPWTGTFPDGDNIDEVITLPAVQGYAPADNATTYHLQINEISGNETITIVYLPAKVKFTVIHKKQNINDDDYTDEVETEVKQGYTEDPVGAGHEKKYAGFYALKYDTSLPIAADGGTEFEIHYDRYYRLMNFELNGGYGVEPIYARFGAPISVGTPVRAGYTFKGWSIKVSGTVDDVVALPETMPAEDQTYYAVWEANKTAQVTVVFWGENANDEEYSYIHSSVTYQTPNQSYTYTHTDNVTCVQEVHTHTNSCYGDLICTLEAHSHSDGCYTCGEADHTHGTGCYEGVGTANDPMRAPDNPVNGQIYSGSMGPISYSYIYINGRWYNYSGNLSNEAIAQPTCHTHTPDCIGCGKSEHAHTTDECYRMNCGKLEHTHSDNCRMSSSLWTFDRSETATVAADGTTVINVYYDRTTFTLTFKATGYNGRTLGTITDKWGADIAAEFKTISDANTYMWSRDSDGDSPWTSYLSAMPAENRTYYAYTSSSTNVQSAQYIGQDLNGDYTVDLWTTSVKYGSNLKVSEEEFIDIEGFTFNADKSTKTNATYNGAKFYYDRNSYILDFYSGSAKINSESVLYEANLGQYDFTPASAPAIYEPGSVYFDGWYLNPECSGEEFVLADHTMDADNLILYAKWTPVTRTVRFYLDEAAMKAGTELEGYGPYQVPHGKKIRDVYETVNPDATPSNGLYEFAGWFYIDEDGTEKAFNINSMPVTQDLQLFAKWSSNVLMEYKVSYAVENADGSLTYIAEDDTGTALAGTSKTFSAKYGDALKEGYQTGYFPKTNSHTLNIDIDNLEQNEYTFIYVQADKLTYTVRYLEKDTNKVLHEQKTVETSNAIVTENFVSVKGYRPDAYQKRLILSLDATENVITFLYTVDEVHAPVQIIHYIQNVEGEGYSIYRESTDLDGVIGNAYDANVLTINGFTYDHATVNGTAATAADGKVSGQVTENGLLIELYYDRNEYPYEFRFLESGNDSNVLHDPVGGTARYGARITQSAFVIEGYELVSGTSESQAIDVKIEDGTTAVKNVKTFYYVQKQYTINYVVVGPEGCGTVTPETEKVAAVTGLAMGSTATASSNAYKFVGWYKDVDCKEPVGSEAKYVPTKEQNALWPETSTYYAKFEYNLTDLTIVKTGANEALDPNASFIFTVTGEGINGSLQVVIKGNGSAKVTGLTVGKTYTVTEVGGWSWRYTATCDHTDGKITLTATKANNVITFENKRTEDQWIDSDCYAENNFGPASN